MKHKQFRSISIVIIAITVVTVTFIGWKAYKHNADTADQPQAQINSFEECAAAGNPILESYPEQCTANGKMFTKQY